MRQTVKKLTERRREVNARLAAEDAKNRCRQCRRNLSEVLFPVTRALDNLRFCSDDCHVAWALAQASAS